MKTLFGALLALLCCCQSAEALTSQQRAEIERGEVVVQLLDTGKATSKDVVAIGYVDAPAETVWKTITDYEHYPQLFPSILKSEIRKRDGNLCHHYTLLDYPWPLPDRWVLAEAIHEPSAWRITWHRLEGTVKELTGSWQLRPEGKRTLVTYTTRFDPGVPLVPQWVIDWGSSHIAPQIIQNLRKAAPD